MGPTRISVRATWTNSCGVNAMARRKNLRTLTFSNTWLKCILDVYVITKSTFMSNAYSLSPIPMKEYKLDRPNGCLTTHVNNIPTT